MVQFTHPSLLLLAIPAWFAYRRLAPGDERGLRRVGRCILLGTLIVMAAGPIKEATPTGSTVILVIDRSRSMPAMTKQFASELVLRASAEQRPGDKFGVVGFAETAIVEQYPDPNRPRQTPAANWDQDQSNLHTAIATALDLIPAGEVGRVIVVSDGLADDALADALRDRLQARGVRVDFQQFPHAATSPTTDVAINSVIGPVEAARNADIPFRVEIVANEPAKVSLQVSRDGVLIAKKELNLAAGTNEITWSNRVESSGVVRYSFHVADLSSDLAPGNNSWDHWLRVQGDPTVLVLNAGGLETPLVRAIRAGGVFVETAAADKAELLLEKLSAHQACVLENVPVQGTGSVNAQVLTQYVEQLGGGLIVTGGNQSYSSGGYRESSLALHLPVLLRSLGSTERPPCALVVLVEPTAWQWEALDDPDKLSPMQQAIVSLSQELDPADRIGVVTPRTPDPVVLPLTVPSKIKDVRDAVAGLGLSSDPTEFPRALSAAWDLLARSAQPGKHLMLLINTDQLARWPAPQLDPIVNRPINGGTVTIVTWGSTDVATQAMWQGRLPHRIVATSDANQLGTLLRQDWETTIGGSFVNRPTVAIPAGSQQNQPAGSARSIPVIPGFHAATLREGASAPLIARDSPTQPLVAHWDRKLGRITTVLFPFAPPDDPSTWDSLTAAIVAEVRWAARLDEPRPSIPIAIERIGRIARVTISAGELGLPTSAKQGPFELVVAGREGNTTGEPARFQPMGDKWLAEFKLDRARCYLPVVQSDGRLVVHCPPIGLPRSPEYLNPASAADGRAVLERLAQAAGGSEWVHGAPFFDDPGTIYRSLVPALAWFAALLLLCDVADRRYRFAEVADLYWHQSWTRRLKKPTSEISPAKESADVFELAKERLRQRLKR